MRQESRARGQGSTEYVDSHGERRRRGSAAAEYVIVVGLVSLALSGAVYCYAFGDGTDRGTNEAAFDAITAVTDQIAAEVEGRPPSGSAPSGILSVR
jgi:hypothetical protein